VICITFKKGDSSSCIMPVVITFTGWSIPLDYVMKFTFAIISLFVSLIAFTVYRLTNNQQSKWFGVSFFLIFLSYTTQTLLNFSFTLKLIQEACYPLSAEFVNIACQNIRTVFYIGGLTVLTYMSLKIDSKKTLLLLLLINVLSLLFASSNNLFYLLSSIMLFFIFLHFLANYHHKKQIHSLIALIAFALLFISSLQNFILINHNWVMTISNVLELLGFFLILINLVLIVAK
jgi:hypothetical protein